MIDEQSRAVQIMNEEFDRVYENAPEMDNGEIVWPH